MKRIFSYAILALMTFGMVSTAEAKKKPHGHKHHGFGHKHHRTKTIYVIENRRPVSRVVYVDDDGRYYRHVGGRRSYIRGRYFTSYPSRYYYPDGRPRAGISIRF